MDGKILQKIEQIIEYHFSDHTLLEKACAHTSSVDNRHLSNERLEFLGDAVLGVVICQTLFERFPGYLEGDLTKIKSMLVSRRMCAKVAKQLGLQEFLRVGKGMDDHRALTGSLSAGLLEALIAAMYVDGGLEVTRNFILKAFGPLMDQADARHTQGNFKSVLQQYAQQYHDITPVYALTDEKGPDHNKCFEVEVVIGDRRFPAAWGTNKKEAEQKAAFHALVELNILDATDSGQGFCVEPSGNRLIQ